MGIHGGCHRSVDIDLHLAILTFLCSDDDDAVGSAAAIDRCRSRIFEHLDAFYISSIELVHAGFCRHAVDDIKWVIVVERSHTADSHGSSS